MPGGAPSPGSLDTSAHSEEQRDAPLGDPVDGHRRAIAGQVPQPCLTATLPFLVVNAMCGCSGSTHARFARFAS